GPLGTSAPPRRDLENREIPVELPLRERRPVVLPFLPLDLDEAREHVLAERLQDQLRLRRDLDRLAERLGKLFHPELLPLVRRQVVQVSLHRLRQLVALLDSV